MDQLEVDMNIWHFQARLTSRLLKWAVANLLGGALLAGLPHPFWRGFGIQSAGWGLVNALIASWGSRSARKRQASLPDAYTPERQALEARGLRRLLWLNCILDVFYVLGGLSLIRSREKSDRAGRGHGWGILVQGSYLFFFDLIHVLLIRRGAK